jgi:glutaredoxin 3
MKPVIVYSSRACAFCTMAKRLLTQKGAAFEEILVDIDDTRRDEMILRSGRRTVPQVFIGGKHVGGYDDLAALERRGQLDALLGDD